MYGTAYYQDAKHNGRLCVVITDGAMKERAIHIEFVGAFVHNEQNEIKDVTSVKIIGACDNTCKHDLPGGVKKVMRLSGELGEMIMHASGFDEAIAMAEEVPA